MRAAAVEDIRRQPARLGPHLQGERYLPVGRLQLVVGSRDLERGRLVAGVLLERQSLESERFVDREVGESREVVPDVVRDRAVGGEAEDLVLLAPVRLDLTGVIEFRLVIVIVLVLVIVLVVPVLVRHPRALPTTACASSMIRSRCASPRKLSA